MFADFIAVLPITCAACHVYCNTKTYAITHIHISHLSWFASSGLMARIDRIHTDTRQKQRMPTSVHTNSHSLSVALPQKPYIVLHTCQHICSLDSHTLSVPLSLSLCLLPRHTHAISLTHTFSLFSSSISYWVAPHSEQSTYC